MDDWMANILAAYMVTMMLPLTEGKSLEPKKKSGWKHNKILGSITMTTKDSLMFVSPRQDCILMLIMHSVTEEFLVYYTLREWMV